MPSRVSRTRRVTPSGGAGITVTRQRPSVTMPGRFDSTGVTPHGSTNATPVPSSSGTAVVSSHTSNDSPTGTVALRASNGGATRPVARVR